MTQTHMQGKAPSSPDASSLEELPADIVHLLQILARIEARRQAKLRAERRARTQMTSPRECERLMVKERVP